jgi:hypothetical protein
MSLGKWAPLKLTAIVSPSLFTLGHSGRAYLKSLQMKTCDRTIISFSERSEREGYPIVTPWLTRLSVFQRTQKALPSKLASCPDLTEALNDIHSDAHVGKENISRSNCYSLSHPEDPLTSV